MIEKFTKSLEFLGFLNPSMSYQSCDKNLFKFDDAVINKHWLCFYAFYLDGCKKGRIDALNEISIECINKLNGVNK